MNKRVNRKIKAGLVIAILLGVVLASVTIDANENNDCRFEQIWQNRFFANDGIDQIGYSFDIVYNGLGAIDGFIIAGWRNISGDLDILLMRTNVTGEETWNETIGESESNEYAWCIQQTDDDNDGDQDDGYIIVGIKDNKTYLVKTDENGQIDPDGWETTFNNSIGRYVQQTSDGGYIITGSKKVGSGFNDVDLWLLKTDANGNETWNSTYDGYTYWDSGFSVQQTKDGGYIVTGILDTVQGNNSWKAKCPLLKYNFEGNLTGNWTYGNNNSYSIGTSVKETPEGDYILTGYTNSSGLGFKVWLIKETNISGHARWIRIYEDEYGFNAWSVDFCPNGGYILTGTSTNRGMYVLKTDDDGSVEFSNIFKEESDVDYYGRTVQSISSNEYIIAGWDGYLPDPSHIVYNRTDIAYNETDMFITKIITNTRPEKPTIDGETPVKPEEEHDYTFTATDPDGHDVYYYIDWDDGNVEEWIGPYDSGVEVEVSHSWQDLGIYSIKAKAKDIHGFESDGWAWLNVTVIDDAPSAPDIEGPTDGKVGETYEYKFKSTDPEGHDVYYYIDWDDGNVEEWIGPYDSGEEVIVDHTWTKKGTYTIRAKAKDVYDAESDWGTLEVTMPKIFGYTVSGTFSQNIKNKISGSNFTMLANGTAGNITAYIQANLGTPPKTKCMIYRNIDSTLIGTTDEKTLNTGDDGAWVTYNFSDPKPTLVRDTEYVLTCWSNDTCNLSYDNATSVEYGRYRNQTYGTALDSPINWTSTEPRIYSIYCRYTSKPEITNVCAAPNAVGFGFNITISADVNDNACGIDNVTVNITYPNNATGNFTMDNAGNDTYEYVFSDTWIVGQYDYTIWAVDKSGGASNSSGYSFNVSAQANISVCTIKNSYGDNETVNLTDPPSVDPPSIGSELLDGGDVLHMWNEYNSYYFNTSSGIQMTNHYDEYWSHNVLMLGYYNNDEWNLIYRTDELSGFNKNISTDNETFVNATLWKDLTYGGYDFRLAVRYHLGADDSDLTVIPYIKNLGQAIPYTLAFGWEIKDIKIADTYENDSIRLYNGTDWLSYRLNQTLDNTYTDMDYNTTFYLEGRNEGKYFRRTLYLRWNHTLDYLLKVKSRDGQYNAPVTLFIKVGTLAQNQEKYTEMHWLDSDDWLGVGSSELATACEYKLFLGWALDGIDMWSPSTNHEHEFILDLGKKYSIKKFRGRSESALDPTDVDIYISTDNSSWGTAVASDISTWQDTSSWVEVNSTDKDGRYIKVVVQATEDANHRLIWGLMPPDTIFDVYGGVVNTPPVISNPIPVDGSTGVSLTPTLNITASDANGDNMTVTWLSNSSGSWQVFGTNASGNATLHQTFSNATENGKWWYWKVNVTDGKNYTVSSVYKFYTGCQSKIVNTGSTAFKGYLLIQVQYYNNSSTWVVADDTINETSPRTVDYLDQQGQNVLALDTIFNGLVNASNLSSYGNGTYRIYAAFRDPDGNILKCDDETELVATYEFTITFD
ncbi:F5/8 type C domain-containing protein [Thermoplasmatales archaeon SCGC AB-540-F20]|nr:F5/8 type C domain-containing protein [Thermoplasmatales archaeon SCGC AB-540-F20]